MLASVSVADVSRHFVLFTRKEHVFKEEDDRLRIRLGIFQLGVRIPEI